MSKRKSHHGRPLPKMSNPPAVCTHSSRCIGCPYPGHGFLCWGAADTCLWEEMNKIKRRERRT